VWKEKDDDVFLDVRMKTDRVDDEERINRRRVVFSCWLADVTFPSDAVVAPLSRWLLRRGRPPFAPLTKLGERNRREEWR